MKAYSNQAEEARPKGHDSLDSANKAVGLEKSDASRQGEVTRLFGGECVRKDSLVVEAYGTADELNSCIGLALSKVEEADVREALSAVQAGLFKVGSDLAAPLESSVGKAIGRVGPDDVSFLERLIAQYHSSLPALSNFIIPGGCEAGARLHMARAICRRLERDLVNLRKERGFNADVMLYVNRLSDLLFCLARSVNHRAGSPEVVWAGRV